MHIVMISKNETYIVQAVLRIFLVDQLLLNWSYDWSCMWIVTPTTHEPLPLFSNDYIPYHTPTTIIKALIIPHQLRSAAGDFCFDAAAGLDELIETYPCTDSLVVVDVQVTDSWSIRRLTHWLKSWRYPNQSFISEILVTFESEF